MAKKKENQKLTPAVGNSFTHSEREHKDWYYAGLMGNLGDKRGYLPKERKKPAGPTKRAPKGKA